MSDLKPSASSPVLTGQGSPRTPKKLGDSGGKSDKSKPPPISPRGLTGSGGVNITYSSPSNSQPSSPSNSLKRSASFRIPDENSQSWRTITMPGNKSERRKSVTLKSTDTKKLTSEDFLKEDNLEIWRPNMYRSTSQTSLTKAWKDGEDRVQGMTVTALEAALKESIFDPKFYKRQRSDSLPVDFVFFSNDEEEALIGYQEKLNAAPSIARIRKARERGESISNSSASGDISMSVASGDLDDSDDEDDVMREASEVRLAAEELQLPDDVFSVTHEELMKRMTEEEKEDLVNIVVDDQGHIESGTIRALIRRLTSHLQEAEFLDSFMYTYDIFIDAYTLLKALILLYRCPITSSTPLQNSSMISSSSAPSISATNGPVSMPALAPDDSKAPRRSSVTNTSISIGTNRRPSMTDSHGESTSTPQSPTLRGLTPKLPSKHQFASRSTGNLIELAKMKEEMSQQRLSGDDMDGPTWARPSLSPLSPTGVNPEDPQQRQKVVLQFRIIKAIGRWIELRYEKLRHNKKWKVLFKNLTERLSQGTAKEKSWATNLIGTRKEVQDQKKQIRKTIKASIISHPPMPSRPVEFLELSLEDLTKQMTLIDQRYFFNIKLKEYANKGWTRDNSASLSPNLLKFIDHFNQNSYWVASTIILAPGCGEAGPKQRAAIITRYIQMMELFKELNNFNAIQQIFSALNMSCVERLKKAWGCVQPKYMKIFEEMGKFVSQSYSYKEYREYLEYRVQPPIIPLQEVILRDLFFIEENPNLDPDRDNWVNFDKMAMLGKVFEQIRRCQRTPYKFKEDPIIQYYMANRIILKETDLFIGSKTAEPKLDPQVEMKKREQEKKQRKIEKQHERAAEKAKKIEAKEEKKKKREQDLKKRDKKADPALVKPNSQKTLDDVLVDRKTYLEFETFMKTKYAEENLEFYQSVHTVFKKLNFDDRSPENLKRIKDQSTRIYDKFVKNDAEFQINIGEDTRELIVRVCQTSEQPTKDLFDVAALEVRFNVLGPNFNEFIKSSTK